MTAWCSAARTVSALQSATTPVHNQTIMSLLTIGYDRGGVGVDTPSVVCIKWNLAAFCLYPVQEDYENESDYSQQSRYQYGIIDKMSMVSCLA